MKKGVPFVWNQTCQNSFDSIKHYLLNPLVLTSPTSGKPLLLYIAAMEFSLGVLLAQHNEEGKEHALYYFSRRMVGAKLNYLPSKKICLDLIFA